VPPLLKPISKDKIIREEPWDRDRAFPSMDHARAWYNDPEYAPMKRLRQAGSRLNFLLVEGAS
jgi:uncharacterized protein (DUF1330 family)